MADDKVRRHRILAAPLALHKTKTPPNQRGANKKTLDRLLHVSLAKCIGGQRGCDELWQVPKKGKQCSGYLLVLRGRPPKGTYTLSIIGCRVAPGASNIIPSQTYCVNTYILRTQRRSEEGIVYSTAHISPILYQPTPFMT